MRGGPAAVVAESARRGAEAVGEIPGHQSSNVNVYLPMFVLVFCACTYLNVWSKLLSFFGGFKSDAHPMAIMVSVVGALSAFYPDSVNIHDAAQRRLSAIRMAPEMSHGAPCRARTAKDHHTLELRTASVHWLLGMRAAGRLFNDLTRHEVVHPSVRIVGRPLLLL